MQLRDYNSIQTLIALIMNEKNTTKREFAILIKNDI